MSLLAESLQWGPFPSRSPRAAGRAMAEACTREVVTTTWITPCSLMVTVRIEAGCTGWCATAGALGGASLATFVWSASARVVSRAARTQRHRTVWLVPATRCLCNIAASALSYLRPGTPRERGTSDANSSLATFPKPFPKPFLLLVLGLSKECRGVTAKFVPVKLRACERQRCGAEQQ